MYGAGRRTNCLADLLVAQAKVAPHEHLATYDRRHLPQTPFERLSLGEPVRVNDRIRLPNEPIHSIEIANGGFSLSAPQLIQTTMVGDTAQPAPQAAALLEFFNPMKHVC